mgnify:FL=1|tara:strand:+ start:2242 stop:2475 length:234 start_codon:yes stop_codon:yes gene_type:complete
MGREHSLQVKTLMAEMKETTTILNKVKTDYDDRLILLQKRIASITQQLRNSDCEHEWKRDSYPYAELYCKHCTVWKR